MSDTDKQKVEELENYFNQIVQNLEKVREFVVKEENKNMAIVKHATTKETFKTVYMGALLYKEMCRYELESWEKTKNMTQSEKGQYYIDTYYANLHKKC